MGCLFVCEFLLQGYLSIHTILQSSEVFVLTTPANHRMIHTGLSVNSLGQFSDNAEYTLNNIDSLEGTLHYYYLANPGEPCNFQSLEVVDRVSETQLRVSENSNCSLGLYSTMKDYF